MKKVLVTGGAGFIGSHLCEKLLSEGYEVLILDNFNDFYSPLIKRNNIEEIKRYCIKSNISMESLKILEGDIRDKALLDDIFKNEIDLVIHLAAMAGVRPSILYPNLYCDVNINGTVQLLEKCKEKNIKKFIFASSSSVYGNNKKTPFSESDNVDNPISPYAATKKAGELLCSTYSTLYNIDIIALRFFTVYGPRQRPDLAIHKFTKLITEGKEIPFYGDGNTARDYTYIEDILEGIMGSVDYIASKEGIFDIFNLGGDKTIYLKDMVETIEQALGIRAIIKKLPMQPGDVNRTCADIENARKILKYSPRYNFKDGIYNFVKWYKENYNI